MGEILKTSIDKNFKTRVPYNYIIMETANNDQLVDTLSSSKNVNGYLAMHYIQGEVTNENIKNKNISINEIDSKHTKLRFSLIKGKQIYEGNKDQILVSENYATMNHLKIQDTLSVKNKYGIKEYKIKGIYDSAGINDNWILKESQQQFTNVFYLVNFKNPSRLQEIKNSHIVDINTIGQYVLFQMHDFFRSFQYMSFLFIFSAVLFNITMMYLEQQLSARDFMIMHILGLKSRLLFPSMLVKSVVTVIIALFTAWLLYICTISTLVQMVINGKAVFTFHIWLPITVLSIVVCIIGHIILRFSWKGQMDDL